MGECTSEECLRFINCFDETEESVEVLQFHSDLFLAQLSAIRQLNTYHSAFPWRAVQFLDSATWRPLLQSMKEIWEFVVGVADVVRPCHQLYHDLAITRSQPFRDLMLKAERLGYLAKV